MNDERTERILLYGVLPLLLIVVAWVFFLGPRYSDYRSASQQKTVASKTEDLYKSPYKVSQSEQAAVLQAYPAAPDPDATRRWLETTVQSANGSLVNFHLVKGTLYSAKITVPKKRAATFVGSLLQGVTRDELLPIARAGSDAKLIRVQGLSLTKSQSDSATLIMQILIPTR